MKDLNQMTLKFEDKMDVTSAILIAVYILMMLAQENIGITVDESIASYYKIRRKGCFFTLLHAFSGKFIRSLLFIFNLEKGSHL